MHYRKKARWKRLKPKYLSCLQIGHSSIPLMLGLWLTAFGTPS